MCAQQIVSKPFETLNPVLSGLKPSATLAINEHSAALEAAGRKVYRLGFGQSPFPVPPTVVDQLKQHASEKAYLPVRGLTELRQAVADFHTRFDDLDISAENILIGPGSKELMYLLQLVTGTDLILPAPSWVSYGPQAQLLGRKVHWVQTTFQDKWCMNAEALEALCKTLPAGKPHLLVINSPNNPTGLSYDADELQKIAFVAKKYDLLVLSDEIYAMLYHHQKPASIATWYPEGTMITAGLSKWCGAGGWRVGTIMIPDTLSHVRDALAVAASETYTSVSAPIQYAAVTAFKAGDDIQEYLNHSRELLRNLGHKCASMLQSAGVKVHTPDGGFYLFPDFTAVAEKLSAKGITTNVQLANKMLDEIGVATLPGVNFGRPTDHLTLRMAYVNFDGEAVLKALQSGENVSDKFLEKYCADTIQAIRLICDWIS